MEENDNIAIIVPAYNIEECLVMCIESILKQTYTNFKLIIVDDGSTDNTPTICDEYKQKDNRIITIHQNNIGLSGARNTGIEYALSSNASLLTFIDGDDFVSEKYLEYLYYSIKNTHKKVAICNYLRTTIQKIDKIQNIDYCIYDTQKLFIEKCEMFNIAWGKLYYTKDFIDVRFPIGKYHEDEYTTYKILFKYDEVCVVNNKLYNYYQREGSITGSKWNLKRLDSLEPLKDRVEFFISNKKYNSIIEYSIIQLFDAYIYSIKKTKINNYRKENIKLKRDLFKYYLKLCKYISQKNKMKYIKKFLGLSRHLNFHKN